MVFSSSIFLFLFLPVLLLTNFVAKDRYKNVFLILFSFIFYAWKQPRMLILLILCISIYYISGLLIKKASSVRNRKIILAISIITCLAILFYFKYMNFTIDIINRVFNRDIEFLNIVLPLGISFFTFSGISYLVDVYNNEIQAEKNIINFALYISFFPKLLQGPITNYSVMVSDFNSRPFSLSQFSYGAQRFIVGLAKKVIIADSLGTVVDAIWNAGIEQNTIAIAWLGSISYTLQIYYDFSGYSDMAIGLAELLGFHLPENFKLPYVSKGISEFWRRWHITLGTWFRKYVYIPLGGNRRHVYFNLSIVFLLTGLWHGASTHFVIWGIFNGVFMLIERFMKIHNIDFMKKFPRLKNVSLHIYALFITNIAWVFFRAPRTQAAIKYIGTMFGIGLGSQPGFTIGWYLDKWFLFVLVIGVFFSSSLPSKIIMSLKNRINSRTFVTFKYFLLLLLFLISISQVISGTYNSFIYFQF